MTESNRSFPIKKIIAGFIIAVLATLLLWGIQWATYARPPLPEAINALQSDDQIRVSDDPWLTFTSAQTVPTTGFIFYPGGRIDPRGYAPLTRAIAAEGVLVVVPEMPINMAVFNPNVADAIMEHYPDVTRWVIGGHSVGGTMAAQYTHTHRDAIDGLVIWASYPAGNANLSDATIPVTTIYGTLDPRVNDASIAQRTHLLPEDTQYIRIGGGDHHQFGSYVTQPEDDHATIARADQQNQIIRATLDVLERAVSG